MRHPIYKHRKSWDLTISVDDPQQMLSYTQLHFTSEDGKMWKLVSGDFTCKCLETSVNIPNGFLTNFASIPTSHQKQNGPPSGQGTGDCYVIPAMVHDALCRFKTCSRFQADRVFLTLLKYVKCNSIRAGLMYAAVTLFSVIVKPFEKKK